MTQPAGGSAIPVYVVTDDELRENGGAYAVAGAPAIPVYGYTVAPSEQAVAGGPAVPVRVIESSDLIQNGGTYRLGGAPMAMPVYGVTAGERAVAGGPAIPVYPVNDWPPASGPTYLFGSFRFATNQAAPLVLPYTESDAEGALLGTQTDGQFSISGEALNVPLRTGAVTTGATSNLYSQLLYQRLTGRALMFQAQVSGSNAGSTSPEIHLDSTVPPSSGTIIGNAGWGFFNGLTVIPGVGFGVGFAYTPNVFYEFAIILRSVGAFMLARPLNGTWKLYWVGNTNSVANFYIAILARSTTLTGKVDDLRLIDLSAPWSTDYGIALNHSTFTAADGTALTAITPEIGGAWTARNNTLDIQSNRANATGVNSGSPEWVATVAAGASDVFIETTVRFTNTTNHAGIITRYTNNDNLWLLQINGANSMQLYERNAGTWTLRASTSITSTTDTDYRLVVVAEGSTITAYFNNGSRISYSSATLNQTATDHGFRIDSPGGFVDNFAIYPRTLSGAALAALNGV